MGTSFYTTNYEGTRVAPSAGAEWAKFWTGLRAISFVVHERNKEDNSQARLEPYVLPLRFKFFILEITRA
ncbi:MAG TPA: hypothetical protein VKV39_15730 [Candidatus Sulfotelmatobacter sp.]|nr:hypothetical protein [Candidatus Sulfotelmatobacter sp.]